MGRQSSLRAQGACASLSCVLFLTGIALRQPAICALGGPFAVAAYALHRRSVMLEGSAEGE